MRKGLRVASVGGGLLALALAGSAWPSLPKLPKERALPRGADSPGVVVFKHAPHVDHKRPDCTTCHPALFPILQRGPRITHEQMEAGRQCGACHDGKSAPGLEDCAVCHRDE